MNQGESYLMLVDKYSGAGGSGHGVTEETKSKMDDSEISSSPYLMSDSISVLLIIFVAIVLWKFRKPK